MLTFFSLIFLIFLSFTIKESLSCPASGWIECANGNADCIIPNTISSKLVTVAFGVADVNTNRWVFQDVANINGANNFRIRCDTATFGDIAPGVSKHCCYYNEGSILIEKEDISDFLNEDNWKVKADEGGVWDVGVDLSHPLWFRYGSNGRYTYRIYKSRTGNCNNANFGDPNKGVSKSCYYYTKNWSFGQTYDLDDFPEEYVNCGSDGSQCNMQSAEKSLDPSAVRLVSYGNVRTQCEIYGCGFSTQVDSFYFRHVLSMDGKVDCKESLFDSNRASSEFCMVNKIDNSKIFVNPTGSWKKVIDCAGCDKIEMHITEGVENSNTFEQSATYTESLETSIKQSLSAIIGGNEVTVKGSVSESVSEAMKNTLTFTSTQTCRVICEADEDDERLTLWQWVVDVDEVTQFNTNSLQILECFHVCTKEPGIEPLCPFTECANADCTACVEDFIDE